MSSHVAPQSHVDPQFPPTLVCMIRVRAKRPASRRLSSESLWNHCVHFHEFDIFCCENNWKLYDKSTKNVQIWKKNSEANLNPVWKMLILMNTHSIIQSKGIEPLRNYDGKPLVPSTDSVRFGPGRFTQWASKIRRDRIDYSVRTSIGIVINAAKWKHPNEHRYFTVLEKNI